ncbi:MAG: hypothetical protein ACP5JG_03015 [Anaerolineae bacterium]
MSENEVPEVKEETAPESEKEIEVEVVAEETGESEAQETHGEAEEAHETSKKDKTSHLKDALRQVESFGQALSEALQGRGNVVMVRVNDDALDHLDMLIEAEITSSRSESAAFLISEGINANDALFARIRAITDQIAELRDQLRQEVKLAPAEEEKTEEETSEAETE